MLSKKKDFLFTNLSQIYEKFVDMEKLTPQEEEAMIALWKTGKGIIKAILENVEDPKTPYTTFASTQSKETFPFFSML